MLTWMRRQSGKMWVKALMVVVAATFFGGFGLLSSSRIQSCMGVETERGEDALVLIDGKPAVIERDFQVRNQQRIKRLQSQLREQFPDQPIPEEMMDYDKIRTETMEMLIDDRLLLLEADRLHLKVSDDEMEQEIVKFYISMSRDTSFNLERYRTLVRAIGFTETMFEELLREDLLKAKIMDLINQGVGVLPEEVRERYAFDREKVKLEYVVLDPAGVSPEAGPTDAAVGEYFKNKASDYFLGETRRVDYVAWSIAELMPGLSVGDAEITSYYEGSKDRYKDDPEKVHALQILIKYDQALESEDAKGKALARINEIRAEVLAPGADFAALAKQYSESATKDAGGDLGWFIRQTEKQLFGDYQSMDQEIETAAFGLKIDEVSEPILTQFGFNLIKVVDHMDARYRPLDQIRSEVEEEVRHTKALALARDQAEAVKAAVGSGKSLEDAAAAIGKPVVGSEFFQEGDDEIFRLPDSQPIIAAAFTLERDKIGDPVAGTDHVYLFRVTEIKDAREGELDEVKDRIVAKLKPAEQLKATRHKAETFLANLRSGQMDLAKVALEAQTEVKTQELIERYLVTLTGLSYSDSLGIELAGMDPANPWPQKPVAIDDMVVLTHLLETAPPDLSSFDKDKPFYERFLLSKKQNEVYEKYIKRLRGDRVTYTDRWKDNYGQN